MTAASSMGAAKDGQRVTTATRIDGRATAAMRDSMMTAPKLCAPKGAATDSRRATTAVRDGMKMVPKP